MDWRADAVCRDEDPELFFPTGTSEPALAQAARAKAICGRCPLQAMCLENAVTTGEQYGVWGGELFTPKTARTLRAERGLSRRRQIEDPRPAGPATFSTCELCRSPKPTVEFVTRRGLSGRCGDCRADVAYRRRLRSAVEELRSVSHG